MAIDMNEKEMINVLIDTYCNLQRINKSSDPQKEVENQLKIVKAKLESCGIVTTDLEIE